MQLVTYRTFNANASDMMADPKQLKNHPQKSPGEEAIDLGDEEAGAEDLSGREEK